LAAGETKTVRFTIDDDKLMFYNRENKFVKEAGVVEIFIGGSSLTRDLKKIEMQIN
jgi:hypothetical protein